MHVSLSSTPCAAQMPWQASQASLVEGRVGGSCGARSDARPIEDGSRAPGCDAREIEKLGAGTSGPSRDARCGPLPMPDASPHPATPATAPTAANTKDTAQTCDVFIGFHL